MSLKRLYSRPLSAYMIALEAIFYITIMRVLLFALPFKWIARLFGFVQNVELDDILPHEHERTVRRISWAIHVASHYSPGHVVCFPRALAAAQMLRRRKISATLYLGVNWQNNELEAHAWLRSGTKYVTGGRQKNQFQTLATFAIYQGHN